MQNVLSFSDKWQILCQSLPILKPGERWAIKSILLGFGHLIHLENTSSDWPREPLIFAFNHNCSYETILVPATLVFHRHGEKISFAIDWMYQYLPIIGWLFRQIDPIYVYNKPSTIGFLNRYRPNKRTVSVYDECIARLVRGQSIGIFPEGSRNQDPDRLLKGKKGIGYIALKSQIPILPVGIDFPLRRNRGRIPKFGRLIIRTGQPLYFLRETALYQKIEATEFSNLFERKKLMDYLVARVTDQTMREIGKLCGKRYPFPEPEPPVELERFYS